MKLTKLLIFCFLSILFSVYGQAQDASIKGKVIDENGLPIPGVSILIKGTTKCNIFGYGWELSIKGRYEWYFSF